MPPKEKRGQTGSWKKAAPCLYQYQTNKTYYAVVRRAGKLIRKSLEVTQREVTKHKLRDDLNELGSIAPHATQVRLDECMKEFPGGKLGTLSPDGGFGRIEPTWGGAVNSCAAGAGA